MAPATFIFWGGAGAMAVGMPCRARKWCVPSRDWLSLRLPSAR